MKNSTGLHSVVHICVVGTYWRIYGLYCKSVSFNESTVHLLPGAPRGKIRLQTEEVADSKYSISLQLSASKLDKKDFFGKVCMARDSILCTLWNAHCYMIAFPLHTKYKNVHVLWPASCSCPVMEPLGAPLGALLQTLSNNYYIPEQCAESFPLGTEPTVQAYWNYAWPPHHCINVRVVWHASPVLSVLQSDPFVEISKVQEGGGYTIVYRSVHKPKTLDPKWVTTLVY